MLSFAASGKAIRSFFADPIQCNGLSPGTGLRSIFSRDYPNTEDVAPSLTTRDAGGN